MEDQVNPAHSTEDRSIALPPPQYSTDSRLIGTHPRTYARKTRTIYFWAACLGLLLVFLNVLSSIIDSPLAYAASTPHAITLQGAPSTPNTQNPTSGSTSHNHPYTPGAPGHQAAHAPVDIGHPTQLSMRDGSVDLQLGKPTTFLGSDGRLEVDIPGNALTADDLSKAGGKLTLKITQLAPASGSNAGGSGHWSLGSYLFQLVDARGVLVDHGLRVQPTVKYHYSPKEMGLGLERAYVVLNGGRPASHTLTHAAPMAQGVSLEQTFGKVQTQRVSMQDSSSTLSVTPQLATPSSSLTWQGDASIGTFGKPDAFAVDLNAGGLTSNLPIDLPAGPGGLTPPVSLSYSSESVNGQHSPSGAAGWVGEGWNLSLGSINWVEHNVSAGCQSNCPPGNIDWQNSWSLNDPFGTSSDIIPPNINVSTYYDDTPNFYCGTGNAKAYPCPILWHTANESHDKIEMYVGSINLRYPANASCFRVWLPNGIMEEFGCTPDSLQYYYESGIGPLIDGWNLDLITDPQGNQIHLTYQQDMENWTSSTNHNTYTYPRDAVLASIQYDSPTCRNAQNMCTGSSWAPQMQVVFNTAHGVNNLTGSVPSGCNTGANLRCDDPVDLSGNGGVAAPLVQSTYVLNSVQVQVRGSGSGSWNTLRSYKLSYEQSGPTTSTDPLTNKAVSVAGMLDLTQIQQVGSGGASALMYSGMETSTNESFAYMKVFDLSSKQVTVGPNTTLSYWIYPQSSTENGAVSGSNSTCVAVDAYFTDGSDLRDSGAVDQHGNQLHPAHQCGHLTLDQWNYVTSTIGAVLKGKTFSVLNVGYDQAGQPGGYRGYIDDIQISDPGSSTPLFATDFESASAQPSWTNTSYGSGAVQNVGGICCGLTGPEMGTRQEIAHTDSAALPARTFTYTTQTNYYEDSLYHPANTGNCGPSWNTGNGSGCILWSQSNANNSRFLTSASNGQGLTQSFSWLLARNNTHGVNGGGSNTADTFYCDSHQSSYPCNEADDNGWSHVVLSQKSDTTIRLTQNGQGGAQSSTPITGTSNYSYQLSYPLAAQECSDCVAGFYWGPQNDGDYLSYYNSKFMGFAQATVSLPDGSKEVHTYYATEGWGVYDTTKAQCLSPQPCHNAPWWDLANAGHGHETQVQYYDVDGTTLLKQVNSTYQAICPPAGVAATPPTAPWGDWHGNLVGQLDHTSPIAVCEIQLSQQTTQTSDGGSNSVSTTSNWLYDSFGRVTQETTTSNGGTPTKVVKNTGYVWNDGITATQTSATGTYIIDTVAFTDTEDGSGNRLACTYTSYDGQGYATGQMSTLTSGLGTTQDAYANCGTSSNNYTPSGKSTTTTVYDGYGDVVATSDPDHNAGIAGHVGCLVNNTSYTTCTTYESTFNVFPTSVGNALNQSASTNYGNTGQLFGFGTWPASTTDLNNQTTSYTYDALGRMTGEVLPGETSGDLTQQWVYTNWCSGTAAQAPCEEIDEIDRLDSSTTITKRAFYDGDGRLVETRSPGPVGQDIVTYANFDTAGRQIFKSNPYFVTAYSGTPGSAAYSIPDSTQPGTTTNYPTLRQTSVTDPNSHTSTTTDSVICGVSGTSDTGCYEQSMSVDANGHASATLTGGLGQTNYTQTYTGTSGSFALYATTTYQYGADGDLLSTISPDGTTATETYDALGQVTSLNDPDHGTTTATYDPNGNVTQVVDARGSAGTVFISYDGLDRPLWRNSTNSPTGAWVNYTYDSMANGNQGVGRLTGESFTGSGGLSGAYAFTYNTRGQEVKDVTTVNGTNYTTQAAYNDVGMFTSWTYPTGEVVTPGYDANGWLSNLNTQSGGTTTTLASNLAYTGLAGAAGHLTAMDFGSGDTYTASYDTGMRLTSTSLTQDNNNALMYQSQPAYDAANNVVSVQTSINGATDTQQFCYDALNRMTWAGTSGTPPCSGVNFSAGTLTGAQYQQSDSYNVDGGLTSGPGGSSTYGNSSHPHALMSTSGGYSAAYDATGNLTCRAPNSGTTCSGTQTGQQLSYDAEGRLASWQNQPSSPASIVNYLYDGSGNRVAMMATVNGTTTTTAYIGSIEEVQTTGSSTQTTTYYTVAGQRIAAKVNGTLYYFGYDALGSQTLVLNSNGSVVGSQLYGPYGNQRYSTGTLPTSIGFTGQRTDSVTGLDYYGTRYYDPAIGAFISPDSVQSNALGFDPYSYVMGNPETLVDPNGESWQGFLKWLQKHGALEAYYAIQLFGIGAGYANGKDPAADPANSPEEAITQADNTGTGSDTAGAGGEPPTSGNDLLWGNKTPEELRDAIITAITEKNAEEAGLRDGTLKKLKGKVVRKENRTQRRQRQREDARAARKNAAKERAAKEKAARESDAERRVEGQPDNMETENMGTDGPVTNSFSSDPARHLLGLPGNTESEDARAVPITATSGNQSDPPEPVGGAGTGSGDGGGVIEFPSRDELPCCVA